MSYSLLLTKSKHNNRNFNTSEKYFTHSLAIHEEEVEEKEEEEEEGEFKHEVVANSNYSNHLNATTNTSYTIEEDYARSTSRIATTTTTTRLGVHNPNNPNEAHLLDEKKILLNNNALSNSQIYNNNISTQHFNESETLTAEQKCAAENYFNLHEEEEEEDDDEEEEVEEGEETQEENIPLYKLRADSEILLNNTNSSDTNNSDWIRAPSYFDEQLISELTNEQIQFTLDYFILSGYRVSQMTKTYYDIEAVTKLLDEKEKDLELAATIGKQLLEKDQQLEVKIEYLELQLEKTSEMVNQLKYDITLKDNLLKSFLDSESDSSQYVLNELAAKKTHAVASEEKLTEYKRKIAELEDENDFLRNRADYLEKETILLEKKEAILMDNYARELETQKTLLNTQDELKSKIVQCNSQQEHLDKLHLQIFELQSKIKNLTKDNSDLQLIYESSNIDLQAQLNDMKEKYNECLRVLSKTQEELSHLRKKHHHKPRTSSIYNPASAAAIETVISDEDFSLQLANSTFHTSASDAQHAACSSWLPSNSNSLASEVFCSLAKSYRDKLPRHTSQSSEFVKKVKEKLSKQIPGSNIDSCLPSDSEIDLMNSSASIGLNSTSISSTDLENAILRQQQSTQFRNIMNNRVSSSKFTNCPTPDSVLSTGSASIYSNLVGRSSSFILPEKLKIVKPIEGSQTLQHWQQLARPNLGCLFETHPGVTVKTSQELELNYSKTKLEKTKNDDLDEYDDGVNSDLYDDDSHEYDEQNSIMTDSFNQDINYLCNTNNNDNNQANLFKHKSNTNQLSPTRVELLSKLLEKEEQEQLDEVKQNTDENNNISNTKESNFFLDLFKTLTKKFSSSTSKNDLRASPVEKQRHMISSKTYEFSDPDTPPSSPINSQLQEKTNLNILYDVFQSAKLKCKSALVEPFSTYFQQANAPTPPATPNNELDDEYVSAENESKQQQTNFFEQIVNKLNIFSFKSVSVNNLKEEASTSDKPLIVKPLPIYAHNPNMSTDSIEEEEGAEDVFKLEEDDIEVDDVEVGDIEELVTDKSAKRCETPPSSPSKFSPPLNYEEDGGDFEFNKSTSAFVRVASLNPYFNKSVDLASLLGSLSSLKRNQRLCKYY